MAKYKLSPSALNLFRDCPKCFYLAKNKNIKRPRGIFPSLPGGMDRVLKEYFDRYRVRGEMPPEVAGKLPGELFGDLAALERWRSWRATELLYEDKKYGVTLSGALDDCLLDKGAHLPLDYKTRGSELKDDPRKYYQTQLDCYTLMLEASGYKTSGLAYLLYYWPLKAEENGLVKFEVFPIRIETKIEAAKEILREAALTLAGPLPKPSKNCEYCTLVEKRSA